MVPLVCPTCHTESPEGSRFCSMCGQPLSGSSLVRASSPDRRVQTSPVGTVLPSAVLSALSAASSDGQRTVSARAASGSSGAIGDPAQSGETVKTRGDSSDSGAPGRFVPRAVVDEPTLPVRYRPTRKRSAARALRSVLFGLLWLLLAGLVAMSVVWLLPERQAGPAKETPATVIASVKEPSKPPRMTARPAVPAVPKATTPSPVAAPGSESPRVIPAPDSVPKAPAVPSPVPAEAVETVHSPSTTPTSTDFSAVLSGAARAAWQQDLANIEFVATTYAAQVRACYERSIRGLGGEAPSGRVVVLFSLTDDGKAQQPVISEDSLGLPVLGPCLTQRLSEWRFPRPVGPIRTFRFPFVFAGSRP